MNKIWIFLNIVLDVFPFIFLQYLPFSHKLRLSYKKTMTICLSIMFIQFMGFVWITQREFYTQDIMLLYRISSLITLLLLTLIFICDNLAKVFFIFGLMTPYVMVTITVGSYFSFIFHNFNFPTYMLTSIFRILLILITYPLIYLLIKKYLLHIMKINDDKMWWYALPVPIAFSLISIFFVDPYYEFMGVSLKALLGMLFVFFGSIFTCYFLLKALHQVQEKTELSEREKQSYQLLSMQKEQYKTLAKNIELTKTARHDLRHHLAVISTFIDNEEYKKLKLYVDEYIQSVTIDEELIISENHAVNSIAGYYIRLAKQQNIDISFVFGINNKISISDTDLCIIIGNTMENAIEACNRMNIGKKFINVRAKIIDDNFTFTCDNSFNGQVIIDQENYMSSKRNDNEKGIGLSSIHTVVKKYNGLINTEYTKDTFMVSILLSI